MSVDLCLQLKEINYENYVLIWYEDLQNNNYRTQLDKTFNTQLKIIQTFDQCEEYIRTKSTYDHIYLLLHSRFVHELYSYDYIFKRISTIFFYGDQLQINDKHFKYIQNFSDDLLSKQSINSKSFAFTLYKPSLNIKHSFSFIYFQIILDSLLHMNEMTIPNHTHLISLLHNVFPREKNNFDEFERIYSSDRALDFYQQNSCVSKLFNKILCLNNINCLFLYRFFLHDLEHQLSSQQMSSTINCYQIEYLPRERFDSIQQSIGDFISINSFLKCKLNQQDIQFDENSLEYFETILFEFELNSHSQRPYIQLNPSEIFIMCGSIFRILDVRFDIDKHLWIVQLKSYKKTDDDLKFIFNSIEDELDYDRNQIDLITLGTILWKMKKFHDEEIYFQYLLEILADDHIDRANIYYNLGHIYSEQNHYDLSLKYYEKSLNIWKNCSKSNEIDLANNYNAIATNFWKQSDYQHAYESFHKALNIFRQIFGDQHITVGMCWNNLATVISNENQSHEALDCYIKALHIFQENLPMYHPNLASLHCNISRIYRNLKQYDLALEHLNLSLKIYEHTYPSTHSNICVILKNIAFLYEQKEDLEQALYYYQRIDRIYRQTHSTNESLVHENQEKIRNLLVKLSKN